MGCEFEYKPQYVGPATLPCSEPSAQIFQADHEAHYFFKGDIMTNKILNLPEKSTKITNILVTFAGENNTLSVTSKTKYMIRFPCEFPVKEP